MEQARNTPAILAYMPPRDIVVGSVRLLEVAVIGMLVS